MLDYVCGKMSAAYEALSSEVLLENGGKGCVATNVDVHFPDNVHVGHALISMAEWGSLPRTSES